MINSLGKTIIQTRQALGFTTARRFYNEYLTPRADLDINYSYYMKIEGERIIPSPQVISNLVSVLTDDQADLIITSYCAQLFPQKAQLFKKLQKTPQSPSKNPPPKKAPASSHLNQRYLTGTQVSQIASSQSHYYLFLVLTLARSPIETKQITQLLKLEKIESVASDLIKAKLITREGMTLKSIANEMRFPEGTTSILKKQYEQIDKWNAQFHKVAAFQSVLEKMMLRRVSSRYLSVILSHCHSLLDLIRASDEINPDYNDDVLMLTLSLSQGRLPG